MKLTIGSEVIVGNDNGGTEHTYFTPHEISEYQGAQFVYGTTTSHEVHVVRGVQGVPARPSSFAVAIHEPNQMMRTASRRLGGQDLFVFDLHNPADFLWILNVGVCRDKQCLGAAAGCRLYHGNPAEMIDWTAIDHRKKNVWAISKFWELKRAGAFLLPDTEENPHATRN